MSEGTARRAKVANVGVLAALIEQLKPYQAIALGVIRDGLPDQVNVVTKEELNGVTQPNIIARSGDDIIYRANNPAFALIDFDSKGMPAKVAAKIKKRGGLWPALLSVMPGLAGIANVTRRSTSAGLFNGNTGKKIKGSDGVHIYLAVANGTDIERFLKVLHDRCWRAGLGWMWVGTAGQILVRSIIDRSVYGPERLVFEGGPILKKPLNQDKESRKPIAYDGKILRTRSACPNLTPDEQKAVEKLQAEAKELREPEAAKVRAAYVKERVPELMKRTGKSKAECTRMLEDKCRFVLADDIVLEFVDKDLKGCTVGDVLADPQRFNGKVLADPIEGIAYGRTTALVLLRRDNGMPWIKSFAHGGQSYTLKREAASAEKQAAAGDDAERRAEQIADNIEIGDEIEEPIVPTVMPLEEMQQRLVYIGSSGVIVDRITGRIRKKDVANSEYAASRTCIDERKGKYVSTLNLWLASPDRVQVDVLGWVPGAAQICRPPEAIDGAKTAFNSWSGLTPMKAPKDWKRRAKPFLDHVAFLVPVKSERGRFLKWLAHIIQRPEVLPHTAYLMTTPRTGIGRNLLASMIVRVLRGHVAAGVSLPELLDGGFTGRLSRKLLAIVDEAREGSGDKRFQRAERLKSLVTEEHRHINIKYGTQSIEKNCCRWLMFSNHPDAIPFDNSDRRIVVIENPTERQPPQYYERLFGLLDDRQFIASVWQLLARLNIADFRPGEHAPMNAAKTKALEWMKSDVERAVCEFKEECKTELASREKIRRFASNNGDKHISDNYLTNAIADAGMVNTGRRVKDGRGGRHSVVIVKDGKWTREIVHKVSSEVLLDAMGLRNDIERIIQDDFKKRCKTELASLNKIRDIYVKKSGMAVNEVNERQFQQAIVTAGMSVVDDRRVPDRKQAEHVVVIVDREKWTPERVKKANDDRLLVAMGLVK